ncbi:hypothetical protein D3C87_1104390 [compost metagenome]
MNEWKQAAAHRRDVRHGLLNVEDETRRIPSAKKHPDKPVVVTHRFSWLHGKEWVTKKKFSTLAKAQAYMDAMNRRAANEQVQRGTHPDDVKRPYEMAANQDQVRDAA